MAVRAGPRSRLGLEGSLFDGEPINISSVGRRPETRSIWSWTHLLGGVTQRAPVALKHDFGWLTCWWDPQAF